MEKEKKMQVATFRFGVISDFVGGADLSGGEKERLLGEKSERAWEIRFSGRSRITRSTILGWVRQYERGGQRLESLFPKDREDRGTSRALDEEVALVLRKLRYEMRTALVVRFIKELKNRGMI